MKNPLQSKTVWWNLALALLAFYPPALKWAVANPQVLGLVVPLINLVLRKVSTKKLALA